MRKIYETQDDRVRQDEVRQYLEGIWNCVYVQAPTLSHIDGMLYNQDQTTLQALVEIKTRRNASNKYPTYMLSANKWRAVVELSKYHSVPFLLIVKFTDGMYAAKLKDDYPVHQGGRYDRGDAMDVENCIYIPMKEFKKI